MGGKNYTCGCYIGDEQVSYDLPVIFALCVFLCMFIVMCEIGSLHSKLSAWFIPGINKESKFEEHMFNLSRMIVKDIMMESYTQQKAIENTCEKKIKEIASNYKVDDNAKCQIEFLKKRLEERKAELKELEEVICKYSS